MPNKGEEKIDEELIPPQPRVMHTFPSNHQSLKSDTQNNRILVFRIKSDFFKIKLKFNSLSLVFPPNKSAETRPQKLQPCYFPTLSLFPMPVSDLLLLLLAHKALMVTPILDITTACALSFSIVLICIFLCNLVDDYYIYFTITIIRC